MRSQTQKILLALAVYSLTCLFVQTATADTKRPPYGNPGPVGAFNTLGAVTSLQDKSNMSLTFRAPDDLLPQGKRFDNALLGLLDLLAVRSFSQLSDKQYFMESLTKAQIIVKNSQSVLLRPENLFYVEAQARLTSSTYYIPGVLLSNGRSGFDIGAQSYIGPSGGYGVTLRKDVQFTHQPYIRAVYALNDFVSSAIRVRDALEVVNTILSKKVDGGVGIFVDADSPPFQELRAAIAAYHVTFVRFNTSEPGDANPQNRGSLPARFVHLSTDLQSSIVYGYRFLHDSGDVQFAGVSVSRLIPLHKTTLSSGVRESSTDGLSILLNVQGLFYSPISSPDSHHQSALRTGIALIWQDQIPYVLPVKATDGQYTSGRWQLQGGLEYQLANGIERHDLIGGFVRYRFRRENVETLLNFGKGTDDYLYVGFSVGKSFTF